MVAVTTPDKTEQKWGAENLEGVQIFEDFDEMLEKVDLQAVVIASIAAVHSEQAVKAIAKGLHVLCEKPLSVDIEEVHLHSHIYFPTTISNWGLL